MTIYRYPERSDWDELVSRPVFDTSLLEEKIKRIIEEVRRNGDEALKKFAREFDKVEIENILVSAEEIDFALKKLDTELMAAIKIAAANIKAFHTNQLQPVEIIETMQGVLCWRKSVAIEKVGLYIPGGTAPLFSTVLMLAIPAVIAGCKEISICTPPAADGNIHPAILAAAHFTGVNRIYKTGGAQAIAAMTFGTATIPKVNKIFGPGNQFVTTAKQFVQKYGVAIDMPAGPSEVAVFADDSANVIFVAADLLSQAEHGTDSQVMLVTEHEPLIEQVKKELSEQLLRLPRKNFAGKALDNSKIVLVKDRDEAMALLNEYAPEHLILSCADAGAMSEKVINAGSVFLGHYSPESVGDYASGTNHTLPTNGYAHAYSGVSVDSFVKKITFQSLTEEGLKNIGHVVEIMAEAEGLTGHAEAVRVRRGVGRD